MQELISIEEHNKLYPGKVRNQIRKEQRLEIKRNVISQIYSLSTPEMPSMEEACKLTVELTIDELEDFKCKN